MKTVAAFALLSLAVAASAQSFSSIADAASNTPELSTLLAAVKAANLTDKLAKGDLKVTLFAPTDDAFKAYLAAKNKTADQLLKWDGLKYLLKAHIAKGAVKAADITDGMVAKTWLPNANVTITKGADGVVVKGARGSGKVIKADIPAGAAVIHIVDGVIAPSKEAIKDAPAAIAAWKAKRMAPAAAPAKAKASRRLAERI